MFFSSAVVTARTVANQVNMAAYHFVSNFRTAVNPQIVKRYAAGEFESSKELLLNSTKYSFYLMLIMALPICLEAETLLKVWLGVVPEYSVIFLQLAVITSLFQVFDISFYTALYAKGRIRENALISPTLGFLVFPIIYTLFYMGFSPVSLGYALMLLYAILGLLVKPILVVKIVGYKWSEILNVYRSCFSVTIVSIIAPLLYCNFVSSRIPISLQSISVVGVSVVSVGLTIWYMGIPATSRHNIKEIIKNKCKI